jgi:hypothetical protein
MLNCFVHVQHLLRFSNKSFSEPLLPLLLRPNEGLCAETKTDEPEVFGKIHAKGALAKKGEWGAKSEPECLVEETLGVEDRSVLTGGGRVPTLEDGGLKPGETGSALGDDE